MWFSRNNSEQSEDDFRRAQDQRGYFNRGHPNGKDNPEEPCEARVSRLSRFYIGARFSEDLGVKFPRVTRLAAGVFSAVIIL